MLPWHLGQVRDRADIHSPFPQKHGFMAGPSACLPTFVPAPLPVLLFALPLPLPAVPAFLAGELASLLLLLRVAGFGPGNTVKHRPKFPGPETGPTLLQVRRPVLSRSGLLVAGSQFVQEVRRFGALEVLLVILGPSYLQSSLISRFEGYGLNLLQSCPVSLRLIGRAHRKTPWPQNEVPVLRSGPGTQNSPFALKLADAQYIRPAAGF